MRSFVNHSGDWSFVICYNFEIKGEKKGYFTISSRVFYVFIFMVVGEKIYRRSDQN